MLAGKIQEIEAHSRGWLTKLECVELKGSVSLRDSRSLVRVECIIIGRGV